MNPVQIDIKDPAKFQHVALLVDRDDFFLKSVQALQKVISKKTKTPLDQYKVIPDEIVEIRSFYRYPNELESAIYAAVVKRIVNDEDVSWYTPKSFPTEIPRGYGNPILVLPVFETIKRDREWYWLNRSGVGYKKLEQQFNISRETIRSAIKSYAEKLMVQF